MVVIFAGWPCGRSEWRAWHPKAWGSGGRIYRLSTLRFMALRKFNNHETHIWFYVCPTIEMCHHRRFFTPSMYNIILVTIESHMEWLTHLAYILKVKPPIRNYVYYVWRLTRGTKLHLKKFSSHMTGELISGHYYWTCFAFRSPAQVIARWLVWYICLSRVNQEILQVPWTLEGN